jgi:hypothetical protein
VLAETILLPVRPTKPDAASQIEACAGLQNRSGDRIDTRRQEEAVSAEAIKDVERSGGRQALSATFAMMRATANWP